MASVDDYERARQLLEEGLEAQHRGDLEEAIRLYKLSLSLSTQQRMLTPTLGGPTACREILTKPG
jgi:hypothetical protein